MNNKARGRGKKRKCPSKGQESKYSQEEVVTNNEDFKQTHSDSQIRIVPSFIKKKKEASPTYERIHELGKENIEGCDAPDKAPLDREHIDETETESEVLPEKQETKPRTREANTEAPASPKEKLSEQEGQHTCCNLSPNTILGETGNEPVPGSTDPQVMKSSTKIAEVAANRSDLMVPTGETCGGVGVSVSRCELMSDEIADPVLQDEAENVSFIPSEHVLKGLEQIIQECESSETDDETVKSMMTSVEKVEDMQAHVEVEVEDMQAHVEMEVEDTQAHGEIEEADQEPADQVHTSEVIISPKQDTNQTITMMSDINECEENRKSRKHLSLNADKVISDDTVHVSDSAGELNTTSDPSSTDNSKRKEKEMYDNTSTDQLTGTETNSAGQLQCHTAISREMGEVIADDINRSEMTTVEGAEESTTTKGNTDASILAAPGSDVDAEVDFTDSQLCEAVNMEESANQLLVLQEVRKQRLEGRKIIHDLIVDLSHLNKLVLRTKREIETARRKRQVQSCVQNRGTGQSFNKPWKV